MRGWAYLRSDVALVGSALLGTDNGFALVNVSGAVLEADFIPPAQVVGSISGRVTQDGVGVAEVTLSLAGTLQATTASDSQGRYNFGQLPAGEYTVTASRVGALFVPGERTVTLGLENVTDQDFQAGGVIPAEVPEVRIITPSAAFQGTELLNLTIQGANFNPASVVEFDGEALQTTFVSAGELQAVLSADLLGETGSADIRVVTPPPGGGSSSAAVFVVNLVPDNPLIEGRVEVGAFPAGVAIDPNRHIALVSNEGADTVSVIDLETLEVTSTIAVGRSPDEGIAIDSGRDLALVANAGDNNVSVIDLETNTVTGTIDVGRFPMGIAIDRGEAVAIVVNGADDTVTFIDVTNNQVLGTLGVGSRPAGVAVHDGLDIAVVTNRGSGTVSLIDVRTQTSVGTIAVGDFPRGVAIDEANDLAVVVNSNSDSVSLIDLNDRELVGTVSVGTAPTAVAIHEATGHGVVTNSGVTRATTSLGALTTASIVNINSADRLEDIPVGSAAFGVAVDEDLQLAVVANFGSNDVTVIRIPNPIPRVSDVSPKTFPAGGGEFTITVSGTGFLPTSVVTLNGKSLPTTFVSSTRLRAVVSAGIVEDLLNVSALSGMSALSLKDADPLVSAQHITAEFNVGVSNPGPGGGPSPEPPNSGSNDIEVENPEPILRTISPRQIDIGADEFVLRLSGRNFNRTSVVNFGSSRHSGFDVDETSIRVRIPGSDLVIGETAVSVTNPEPGGGTSRSLEFTVTDPANPAPVIESVDPRSVPAGSVALGLSIEGSGFIPGVTTVRLDGDRLEATVTETSIDAVVPADLFAVPETLSGLVLNPEPGGGTATFSINVLNPEPTIAGFSPETAEAGISLELTVRGTGFGPASEITLDATPIDTRYVSDTELLGRVPAGLLESGVERRIGVHSPPPGGGSVSGGVLAVVNPVPVIERVNPAEVHVDDLPVRVTVRGSGFLPNSRVELNQPVAVTDLEISGSETLSFTVPADAGAGVHTVTVINSEPGGGVSNGVMFTITGAPPELTAVNPDSGIAGVATRIEVRGLNFEEGAAILFDGRSIGTRFDSETSLSGTILAELPGVFAVAVENPDGKTSNSRDFTVLVGPNPEPRISDLNPDPSDVQPGNRVTIRGSGFIEESEVTIDGRRVAIEVLSDSRIRFTAPNLSVGGHRLRVINPASEGGGGGRDSLSFDTVSHEVVADVSFKLVRDPTLIVEGEEAIIALSLSEALDFDLEVTITVADSSVAKIVDEGDEVTSSTGTIHAGEVHGSGPIKGLAEGTTTVKVTADGFDTVTATIRVMPAEGDGIIDSVSPASIIIPVGGSSSFTVTRFEDTQGAPIAIGTSTAPNDIAGVESGLTFGANSLTVSGTVNGLAAGSNTLKVAGVDAPSLLSDHVINFIPPDVDLPPTVDLQTTGLEIEFEDDDDDYEVRALPFTFPFFGGEEDSVFPSTNGYVTFGAGDDEYEWDDPEEFLSIPRAAPFATDLILVEDSSVFTNEITIAGGDAFVVTYEDMGIYDEPDLGGIHTFQVVLFETGAIQFRYGDINNAPSETEEDVWVGVSPQPPKFDEPFSVWGDGTHLYVADSDNDAIRRVSLETREVTTFAGGTNGDTDGIGTAAQFDEPRGITGDGNGNLYVADRANHTIRKIAIATGEVTTLAGDPSNQGDEDGIGSAARFFRPRDLEIVGGDLYVTDRDNHTIRKIVIGTRDVTTFAGSAGDEGSDDGIGTAAQFDRPRGIWSDGTFLYVTYDFNHTVRKIEIATAEVTTFAGLADSAADDDGIGSAARFDRPDGIDGDGTYLYVTERDNATVRRIEIATREVTTLAGGTFGFEDGVGTAAKFRTPSGVWLDGNELYIADEENNLIRRLDLTSGVVDTFSGTLSFAGSGISPGLINGVGALTDDSDETPLNSNYTLARGFIFDKFNPVSDKLISIPVTVTGTPTLTGASPDTGGTSSSLTVTLTGTGFVPGGTTVSVLGSDVTVSSLSVSSTTSLTATFTVSSDPSPGAVNVTVTTGAGTSGTQAYTITVPSPTLSGVAPTSGLQGGATNVTLTGTNFTPSSTVSAASNITVSNGVIVKSGV